MEFELYSAGAQTLWFVGVVRLPPTRMSLQSFPPTAEEGQDYKFGFTDNLLLQLVLKSALFEQKAG